MISDSLELIYDSVEDMYDALIEKGVTISVRRMNKIPQMVASIKGISYPAEIPTSDLPTVSDKLAAIEAIKAQIKTVIENSGVQVGNNLVNYGDCIRAIVSYKTFELSAPAEFTGKNFNVIPYFNGQQVVATNWTITSGSQYATVNQYGRVDIESGTVAQQITISASYTHGEIYNDSVTVEVSYDNQLTIQCADVMTGTSGNCVAVYNSNVISPVWSITTGGTYATIEQSGNITILDSGIIVLQAVYAGYTATKEVNVVYQANTTTETTVDEEGNTTTTTTTTTTDPQTGSTTTETSSTTVNDDGSTTSTESTTTENTDGSSTSTSTTINTDGTSSTTETETSAPDPETGSVTSNSTTVNYDENGDTTGSTENTTVENTDGSSTSTTTNYDENGDPTTGSNNSIDTSGNSNTQDITYDNGEPVVTGYEIDTSQGTSGGESTPTGGLDTGLVVFDGKGFECTLVFKCKTSENAGNNVFGAIQTSLQQSNRYAGFNLALPQTTRFNMYAGTNSYMYSSGAIGSNIHAGGKYWSVSTTNSKKQTEYTYKLVYLPAGYTAVTTDYGEITNSSNYGRVIAELTPVQTGGTYQQGNPFDRVTSSIPTSLPEATFTLGGNGINNSYDMINFTVISFNVHKI